MSQAEIEPIHYPKSSKARRWWVGQDQPAEACCPQQCPEQVRINSHSNSIKCSFNAYLDDLSFGSSSDKEDAALGVV